MLMTATWAGPPLVEASNIPPLSPAHTHQAIRVLAQCRGADQGLRAAVGRSFLIERVLIDEKKGCRYSCDLTPPSH
jgi:hypothetical protein